MRLESLWEPVSEGLAVHLHAAFRGEHRGVTGQTGRWGQLETSNVAQTSIEPPHQVTPPLHPQSSHSLCCSLKGPWETDSESESEDPPSRFPGEP